MTTELRDYGDRQTVVVFTNDQQTAEKLRNRKTCFKTVPYEQEQYRKKRNQLVGYDFYFPRREKKALLRLPGCVKEAGFSLVNKI